MVPLGNTARAFTPSACPAISFRQAPVVKSQMRMEQSLDPLTTRRSSSTATACTVCERQADELTGEGSSSPPCVR